MSTDQSDIERVFIVALSRSGTKIVKASTPRISIGGGSTCSPGCAVGSHSGPVATLTNSVTNADYRYV